MSMTTSDGVSVKRPPSASTADVSVSPRVEPSVDRRILDGASLRVTERSREALAEEFAKIRGSVSPESAEAVLAVMNECFQAAQQVAKNLGVSEKARELARRRAEELEKEMRELEAKKVTVEAAVRRFENTMTAAADRQLLEANLAKQNLAIV